MQINELLSACVEAGASDLHLSAGEQPILRVDGDIGRLEHAPLDKAATVALIREVMNDDARAAFEAGREVDFSFEASGTARFRVNAFRHQRGAGAVFRVIPAVVPTMESLNMPPVFRGIADAPRGLVLVTGPTGSGKSTTLAAMIDYINTSRREHILTIEDPIEFVHQPKNCLVTQRQLNRDTQSFDDALRAALREDPDVVLVGEMRDLETIRLALTAAETGHLVFATLHTSSAPATVDRIVDVFPGDEKALIRTMLSESLNAVVSQTLVKRIGGGRVAAHEIMLASTAIRHLIRENKAAQMVTAIQTSRNAGMQTLDQALAELVQGGTIAAETAQAKTRTPRLATA
ncbi:MAG: type IV pilus twitching motility protein PilT [Gammaproteobacteria bacterium]|nr:type IV pilus twitching motility protein PilT [Gammaproteobacteria bacterium]